MVEVEIHTDGVVYIPGDIRKLFHQLTISGASDLFSPKLACCRGAQDGVPGVLIRHPETASFMQRLIVRTLFQVIKECHRTQPSRYVGVVSFNLIDDLAAVFQISGQPDRKPGKAYKEGAVRINGNRLFGLAYRRLMLVIQKANVG